MQKENFIDRTPVWPIIFNKKCTYCNNKTFAFLPKKINSQLQKMPKIYQGQGHLSTMTANLFFTDFTQSTKSLHNRSLLGRTSLHLWSSTEIKVQYRTLLFITVHYCKVQCSTVQRQLYRTFSYSSVHYSKVKYSVVQYITVKYSATVQQCYVQCSAVDCSLEVVIPAVSFLEAICWWKQQFSTLHPTL